ncbi:MAG TPA: hypothetical protein VFB50_14010 [Chloroflexota bacterium]|nr:hypothetical protein [Chloroflexota bacterium]
MNQDIDAVMHERTVYAVGPSVYYEPYVGVDGRVGYRCQTNNAGDTRETFVYLVPSSDTNDGVPNIFVYRGIENDPSMDPAEFHIALHELEDGPLCPRCQHNLYQHEADRPGGNWDCDRDCHGCKAGEEPHRDFGKSGLDIIAQLEDYVRRSNSVPTWDEDYLLAVLKQLRQVIGAKP